MITQWKKVSNTEFTARWNGMEMRLVYEPNNAANLGPWRLYADGVRPKERWFTPRAAMSAIDVAQTRLILGQSAVVVALQRNREVRSANSAQR